MGILFPLLLIAISSFIIWKTTRSFEIASNFLGRNLPKGIKGSTINAIASSMPELLTSVFFLFYINDTNSFSGSIGVTAGSAIYNIVIIPALVILVVSIKNKKIKIEISKRILLREGIVLISAIVVLILLINQPALYWWHGFILVFIYSLYMLYNFILVKLDKKSGLAKPEKHPDEFYTPSENKKLLFHFININIDYLVIRNSKISKTKAWLIVGLSTFVMSFGSLILVQATEWLGNKTYHLPVLGEMQGLDIPMIFVAVILSSIASSLPDTIISVRDAKNGNYDDSLTNVMGSNTFDISFAIGLPLLLYTLFYSPINMDAKIIEFSSQLWIILLLVSLACLLIYFIGKRLSLIKSILLLLIYLIFTGYIMGLSLEIDWVVRLSHFLFS